MYLIKLSDVGVSYGDRVVFRIEGLEVRRHSRVGLVGRNGAGKSTLMQVLAGVREPDEGRVDIRCKIACIPQEPDVASLRGAPGAFAGRSSFAERELSERPSGGEVTRAAIRSALVSGADILMADEPTTNLDADGIERLEKELLSFKGGLILISHDRELLDSVCGEIWELDDGALRIFPGNYSAWRVQRERERAYAADEYDSYRREKKRLEAAARRVAERARSSAKRPHGISNSEARLISNKNKAAKAQSTLYSVSQAMERRAEKLERKERPGDLPDIKMSLGNAHRLESPFAVRVQGLDVSFGGRVLFEGASFDVVSGKRSVLIGPNGSGKTTLLRLIETPEGGRSAGNIKKAPRLRAGFFSQSHEAIDPSRTALENARAISDMPEHEVRTILARLGIRGDEAYKTCSVLSGGERAKVAFARLLASDLNMIVLDEPTNHIDIYTAEALEELLVAWRGTLLLVTHDRRLASGVAERLLLIEDRAVRTFEGSWGEYEAFRKARAEQTGQKIIEMRMAELSSRISCERDSEMRAKLDAEWRECADKLAGMRRI